jgi:hypothetical protein
MTNKYGFQGRPHVVSRSVRFDVLVRDVFTCQYCGAMAPDAILEVDHILPRAVDGGDEMWNLTTACFDCNRGKSAKILPRRSGPIHIHHDKHEEQRMLGQVEMAYADVFKRYLLGRTPESLVEIFTESDDHHFDFQEELDREEEHIREMQQQEASR